MTQLNAEQRQAVERAGQDVCVVAGPGSGKTRVLIERFCWLVSERQIQPDRILTVTFTKKAASEIKARLVERLHDRTDLRQEVERAYVSTIHGFCTRLLRENSIAAGVDIGFTPIEEPDSRRMLRESADCMLDELFTARPGEARELMESIAVSSQSTQNTEDLADVLIKVYGTLRVAGDGWKTLREPAPSSYGLPELLDDVDDLLSDTAVWKTDTQREQLADLSDWLAAARPLAHGAPLEQISVLGTLTINLRRVPKSLAPEFKKLRDESVPRVRSHVLAVYYAPQRELLIETLTQIDSEYRGRKRSQSQLDFGDLEEYTLKLLDGSPAVREEIGRQFDYILMDELQDTNPLQWQIIDRIRRPDRFFGVGDINQSIYSFRNAEPEVFRRYEESLKNHGWTVDQLVTNYRTRQEILDVVMWAVRDQDGIVEPTLVSGSEFPKKEDPATEVLVSLSEDTTTAAENEARWIAQRIRKVAVEEDIPLEHIAVLSRKMKLLQPISEALRQIGIPSITTGGQGLYEARETKDLMLVCNVLANVHDTMSLAGLIRSPFVGCHDETLLRLKMLRKSIWQGLAAAVDEPPASIPEGEMEKLRWLYRIINELRARPSAAPDSLLSRFIDESGYLEGRDAQGRANIERFLRRLREKFYGSGRPLGEVAEEVARTRAEAPEAEAPPADTANAVQLMSIHASKGLEFPVVFLPSLHSGVQNALPPICRSAEHGIGVRWMDPVTRKNQGDPAYEAVREELAAKAAAEEWRLFYVAMTRAEKHLVLSWSATQKGHGRGWSKILAEQFNLSEAEGGKPRLIEDPESNARFVFSEVTARPAIELATLDGVHVAAPEELPAPSVSGQHDAAVAVTQVSAFLDCPRKYYLRHFLGFRPATVTRWDPEDSEADIHDEKAASTDGAEVGRQVHDLLGGLPVENPLAEAVNLVDRLRATPLSQRIEKATRVEREYGLLFELEDLILRGQIDVWWEEGERLVVADYKTDRFDPDMEPDRLRPYELQLWLYSLALERLTGRLPDEAWLVFARTGKSVEVSLDPVALQAARGCLADLKRAQESNSFPLVEGSHCQVCDFYRQLCPAGRGLPDAS
jgi:ATP-dependent helicase/nuclease subunit A